MSAGDPPNEMAGRTTSGSAGATNGACPSCGYCPHCGRGGYGMSPVYWPWMPSYPVTPPVWIGGNPGVQITYGGNTSRVTS